MYTVKVIKKFTDMREGVKRNVGEIFTIEDPKRLDELLGNNSQNSKFVKFISAKKQHAVTKENEQIVFFQDYLYFFGGIETFLFNLVKYYKDYNIKVMCRAIETPQIIELSKYAEVEMYYNQKFECNTLILGNYNCDYIFETVTANKVYQMIHADWEGIKQLPPWKDFVWAPHPKVDSIITVSETARKGLKKTMGFDSEVIYNILDNDFKEEDGLVFITLSRATMEKGIHRMIEMANQFRQAKKKFLWLLCSSVAKQDKDIYEKIKDIEEFVIIEPSVHNKSLIKGCDYLVQLSDTESFCYSAYESLQRGVPVILTEFPEAKKIIKNGKNGYTIKFDLSNLNVEKIFTKIPKEVVPIDYCEHDKWMKVFKGEL